MKNQTLPVPVHAFVAERESTCRELKTKATIIYGAEKLEVVAQWDTGASGS